MTQATFTSAHPAFIHYPPQAAFGRILPKSKVYEHSTANTRLQDLFVKQVEKIVWAYKLAPETLNLPARPDVPEIQIFSLQLKTPELHHDVLRCIDGAIAFPILFELVFEDSTQVVAAYKRPNAADTGRRMLSGYFATDWIASDRKRTTMPMALHMGGLYAQLLQRLMPLAPQPQESLADLVTRMEQAQAKQRELDKMTVRLEKERQFNRKVEINATVRKLRRELESMTETEQNKQQDH